MTQGNAQICGIRSYRRLSMCAWHILPLFLFNRLEIIPSHATDLFRLVE
jgi:hypothetical protein